MNDVDGNIKIHAVFSFKAESIIARILQDRQRELPNCRDIRGW